MSRDQSLTLNFEISAADHDRLEAAYFRQDGIEVKRAKSLLAFLDTPDNALRDKGLPWCFERKEKQKGGHQKPGDWRAEDGRPSRSFVKKHKLRPDVGGVFSARVATVETMAIVNGVSVEITLRHAALSNGSASDLYYEARLSLPDGEEQTLREIAAEIVPDGNETKNDAALIERGYRLADKANGGTLPEGERAVDEPQPEASAAKAEVSTSKEQHASQGPDVFETFLAISRQKIIAVLAAPPPIDLETIEANITRVRDVHVALRFFANAFGIADLDQSLQQIGEWEKALRRLRDIERVCSRSLKKAASRCTWDGVGGIVTKIGDTRRRSYVVLVQTWPAPRVKNLFSGASDIIERHVTAGLLETQREEGLGAFLDREMPNGIEHIEALGGRLLSARPREAADADLALLREAVSRLDAIASFFEPFTSGKAARRLASLLEAFEHFDSVLDRYHELTYAQELVDDAATHIMRLRQTKTQTAQLFAAGVLTGFFEAMKAEKFDKALRQALSDLADVKPFWTKIDWQGR